MECGRAAAAFVLAREPISHAIQVASRKRKLELRTSTPQDVVLELQPLLDAAYTNGGYADDIDYTKSPNLPLPKIVAEWTSDWLRNHDPQQ